MDYDSIAKQLRVNKHYIDDALEVQAELQLVIGERVAALARELAETKEDLATLEAGLLLDIKGQVKTTVEAGKAYIQRDPARRSASAKVINLREELDRWSALLEAWKQRGYALRELGQLHGSQYFAIRSVRTGDIAADQHTLRQRLRNKNSAV